MYDPLSRFRKTIIEQGLKGFILPVNDEFMGEYVPDSAKRLAWLTGFTGSAGLAIVTDRKAAFFTDGRYTLQAESEVKGFELYNSGEMPPEDWLMLWTNKGNVIGYDPRLHTLQSIRRYEGKTSAIVLKPVNVNPVDALWKDRPSAPAGPALAQPLQYAGETSADKRKRIGMDIVGKGAQVAVITAPDSLCWLLNMRGSDVPFTPFVLCYGLISAEGMVTLYLGETRVPDDLKKDWSEGVTLRPPELLTADMAKYSGQHVLYDPHNSPVWFYQLLTQVGAIVKESADPCQLPKARKNAAELTGMREAHKRDGLAVTKFLCWLDGADKAKLTEMDVAAKLESFRKDSPLYLEPSFTTISGSGPNGAIVHYRVTEATNRKLDKDSMLLLDSGGQYPDGTTDITRTIALGNPSAEMKDRFTRVLKGHIALASAVFPQGTTGAQLDALARQYLWGQGLDYDHGTGHGVGSHLSVHEGPQRIGKRGGDAALLPGMILSNEPGYYKPGEYGIRIENLVVVKEVEVGNKRFLGFETITLAPLDSRLIDWPLLTREEAEWLDTYHRQVSMAHTANLTPEEAAAFKRIVTKL